LFFNLRKARARLATGPDGELTAADRELMAEQLKVTPADIERMETHLDGPDASLNATVGADDDSTQQMDLLKDTGPGPEDIAIDVIDGETRSRWLREAMDVLTPRERQIIVSRFLEEDKSTLAKIGVDFGVSKERIRQIEAKALTKLRHAIRDRGVEPGGALPN
jgi:RNA polymerase sigma-32 factor